LSARPFCVPWYYDKYTRLLKNLTTASRKNEIEVLTRYLKSYCRPWWSQIHEVETVRLFTRPALAINTRERDGAGMARLASLLWSKKADAPDPECIHDFVTITVRASRGSSGLDECSTYLALLAETARLYVERIYEKTA